MSHTLNIFDQAKTYKGIEVTHWWNYRVVHKEAINLKNLKEKEVLQKS